MQINLYYAAFKQVKLWSVGALAVCLAQWCAQDGNNPSSGEGQKTWTFQLFLPQKPIPLKIPHDFFLITPGNSTSFLMIYSSWKFLSAKSFSLDFFCNSPVAYPNNKRKYFSPLIHLIHMSWVILIYNMKIIWSL